MLADFAMRMVFGLAIATAAGTRGVPNAHRRTVCLVLLGFSVLAVLSAWSGDRAGGWEVRAAVVTAVGSYVGATAWALGHGPVGRPATWAVAACAAAWLAATPPMAGAWVLGAAGRGASGLLMGATLAAMLLGHQYLTAPTVSVGPLRRAIGLVGLALAIRAALELAGPTLAAGAAPSGWVFATTRWGMGLVAPTVATVLAWRAAGIRSTQSATGILFAALGLVLAGELASMAASYARPARG